MLDNAKGLESNLLAFGNLKSALERILEQSQPDCVLSTYPVYAHVIREIYRDHSERPFRFITVVTDSISVNSSWFRAPSDWYCVPNEATAGVLRKNGVPAGQDQGLRLSGQSALRRKPQGDPRAAGGRRAAQGSLHHQHRQKEIRQGGGPAAGNAARSFDHHRRARRGIEGEAGPADGDHSASGCGCWAGPIKCRV